MCVDFAADLTGIGKVRRVQLSREEAISLALSSSQFGFHFATEKDEIFRAEEDFVKNKCLGSSLPQFESHRQGLGAKVFGPS